MKRRGDQQGPSSSRARTNPAAPVNPERTLRFGRYTLLCERGINADNIQDASFFAFYQAIGLEGYVRRERMKPNQEIVAEFYAHLQLNSDGSRGKAKVRGFSIPFTPQAIRETLALPAPPPGVRSFGEAVKKCPTLSAEYRALCEKFGGVVQNKRMKSGALPHNYILPNLFNKYDVIPSGTTAELFGKDVVLFEWMEKRYFFDLGVVMFEGICAAGQMAVAREGSAAGGGVNLIYPCFITEHCMKYGVPRVETDRLVKPKAKLDYNTLQKSLGQHRPEPAQQEVGSEEEDTEEEEEEEEEASEEGGAEEQEEEEDSGEQSHHMEEDITLHTLHAEIRNIAREQRRIAREQGRMASHHRRSEAVQQGIADTQVQMNAELRRLMRHLGCPPPAPGGGDPGASGSGAGAME